MGSCGVASGAQRIAEVVLDEARRLRADIVIKLSGCRGNCYAEPVMELRRNGKRYVYGRLTPKTARRILRKHIAATSPFTKFKLALKRAYELLTDDTAWLPIESVEISEEERAFLQSQKRIALERCGLCDPLSVEDYARDGGYSALRKVLTEMKPEEVIRLLEASELRGRGGAGFPTGLKWRLTFDQKADKKYVICNADEGDPGAFMDRLLLESDTHKVLEGLAISAYAVGADEAYVYVRTEYPLAIRRLKLAIERAETAGLLGENILQSGFRLKVNVFRSAGAFVCGEETALIASIEGDRGNPRTRPPYPSERGLWGKPTLINNVETLALVPWIIRNGAEAFRSIGTATSKGTKVFALAGQVRRGGLIEAPMGMTIREIVEKIGGGVPEGRKFKAVQIGGPAGGCIPAELADTPVDYEALLESGTIMGSGGLIVLDDTTCMVDFARFFLPFTQSESCGKCTFCRVGSRRMLELLDKICQGRGTSSDIEKLEETALLMKRASFCGLGRNAPNPVLTSLRYFRDEYEAHINGKCPAGKCRALVTFEITDDCIGCTLCAQNCPAHAIDFKPYEKHEIDSEKCIRCGTCRLVCPEDAVEVK